MANQITPNPSVPSQVVAEVKFPKFINNLGIIPTSYKDSMSYYECLAWLCKFLEEQVIPTVNENGEAVEELQALYVELNSYVAHYFETLDVQEEINNKLDDMVEAGTLQEIIADYLNSKAVFGFDTVADMKEAINLIDGSYAETTGFYSINDGGSAFYKIRTRTFEDTFTDNTIIQMENENLVAELVIKDNTVSLLQVGGKDNDNTFDNSVIINSINEKSINILIDEGEFYCSNTIKINIEKAKIFGISTKSCLIKNETFDGTELLLVYSNNGAYSTRKDRIKNIENLHLLGDENKEIIGIKLGGDNSSTYEGHVDCVNYENIKVTGFNYGLYINSHFYKCNFKNLIFDQCNFSLFNDNNAIDGGEATNFFGCSFWNGALYFREECNFIGCTFHYNNIQNITSKRNGNTYNCYALFDNAQLINFTDCHFESLSTGTFENIFIAVCTQININNSLFLVTPNDGITITDSFFKAIQDTSSTAGNIAEIIVKDCIMKYLLVRITPGSNFKLCKGNVKLFTNTIFKNDATRINYKIYDTTHNYNEGNEDVQPFIITEAYKNGGSITISGNEITLAQPTENSTNTYGIMKKYYVGEHKAGHFGIKGNTCSDTVSTKFVSKFNTDSPNLIQFYDKDGKRITTENALGAVDSLVADADFTRFFNIPSNCEYILFGIGGYGIQYRWPVTFTINEFYLELL